ncbi:MAG TPA: tetratricopeptide repeat protein [Candidatus Udaeobacter sp.]|nr:tetratricopeptide repeat protein [Candidatus Udaeobacter sp.]
MKPKNKLFQILVCSAVAFAICHMVIAKEPLYDGLGSYSRTITTKSAEAQRYFDQGLGFLQGFNHRAAIRAFQQAAELDPECAMAHWGVALACGPHINAMAVPPSAAELAWKELGLAQKNAENASPVERALIDALAKRYANPQPEDRSGLDRAYADAMRQVWKKYPKDPDVGTLFAEAMMNLRPWDQWTTHGKPEPGTDEIIATLDAVLKLNPDHPLANHLYIHAVEASPNPERAMTAADRLRNLQPGLAHNVHMPSHIDIRTGQWLKAVHTNEKAVEADERHRKIFGPTKGFLNVYVAHNRVMLAYAAMMTGQRDLAMKHIRAMVTETPADFLEENALQAEATVAMPLEVMVRFGMWVEILAEPENYTDKMWFTRAFHHAARAIAYAAKGDTASARKAQSVFLERAKLVPKEDFLSNNSCEALLAIAIRMVEGEILIAEGKIDTGIEQLRAAIQKEDALKYDEPPGWMIPVRHSLGAVLMKQKRFAEAEQVYRDDLARLPENGWSLLGLAESLRKQKKNADEVAQTQAKFKKVWAKADLTITTSCLCQPQA